MGIQQRPDVYSNQPGRNRSDDPDDPSGFDHRRSWYFVSSALAANGQATPVGDIESHVLEDC
jgi:hypothetical protein